MKKGLIALIAVFLCVSECLGEEQKGVLGRVLDGLSLDLRTVEDTDGGIAVDFEWSVLDISLKKGDFRDIDYLVSAKLDAQGMMGSKSADDDNTPREISLGANLDLKAIYMELRGFDYRAWLGITAAEIESDQDWDNVNYVFRPFMQFDVPYSRELSRALQVVLGKGKKGYIKPLIVGFGYGLVSEIEGENGRPGEDRFEFLALYKVETYKNIQLTARYRFFKEDSRDFDLFEIKAGFHGFTEGSQLIVKYVNGEMPLSLKESESLSIGWSITF